uniref:Putative amastin-like protein n=1 Tax=Leishmania guyanensis TaxID=5670 RepID=A0A1E1J9I5_LEIGU|nr:Putative amastin-like protein [Leishmania guyanensis]
MYRFRIGSVGTHYPNHCITLWGIKAVCSNLAYESSSDVHWELCPLRRDRFRMGQAFAVISIFVYGMTFVLGVIMLFCCRWVRWVCLTLNIVGAVTLCIVWVAMVVSYYRNDGNDCIVVANFYNYGIGFFLLLVAWVLDIANIPVLLLLWHDYCSGGSVKSIDKESQE